MKNHKIGAKKVEAMAELEAARQMASTMGVPVHGVPVPLALLDEFAHILGHVVWLRGKVQETDPEALVWGKADEQHKLAGEFPGVDTKYAAAPSVWLLLYQQYHRLLLDYAKVIETLKIDQRKLELVQEMGGRFAERIGRFVAALELTPGQLKQLPAALAAMERDDMVIEGQAA